MLLKKQMLFSRKHLMLACIILLGCGKTVCGQNLEYFDTEVSIGHDNDFLIIFTQTDRYYTYGLNSGYRWRGKKEHFYFKKNESYLSHYTEVNLNVEAYTPEYLPDGSADPNEERPYAGWSYLNISQSISFKKSIVRIGIDIGILGPGSQAGRIQNWFHREVSGDVALEGWEDQLPNQLGINLRAMYGIPMYRKGIIDIYSSFEGSVGNIYIYARPMVHFRLGKSMPIQYSIAAENQLLGKKEQREFFFSIALGSKISAYDATVSGNIFKNNELFGQKDINNFIFNGYFGFSYLRNSWSTVLNYHLNTSALNSLESNRYAALSFAHRF